MADMHPAAEALAKAEAGYQKARARAAVGKAARDSLKALRDHALVAYVETGSDDLTVAAVAAHFGISETQVRYIVNRDMEAEDTP